MQKSYVDNSLTKKIPFALVFLERNNIWNTTNKNIKCRSIKKDNFQLKLLVVFEYRNEWLDVCMHDL